MPSRALPNGSAQAAYSPEARGRMERSYGTWQGRLPQELRVAGIHTVEAANRFLRERYIAEFNRRFTVQAAQPDTAFRKCGRRDLDVVFSVQTERVVAKDNTVAIAHRWWQLGGMSTMANGPTAVWVTGRLTSSLRTPRRRT
jgi:hypothetical protein